MEEKQRVFRFLGVTGRDMQAIEIKNFLSIFNCSAGKDRSGVVSAVLLLFAGVKDEDIIENYVVTKYYIKQRLEYIKQNSDIDMAIVTPNKYFMEMFLKMFREKYGDVSNYFQSIGMDRECMDRLKEKFV